MKTLILSLSLVGVLLMGCSSGEESAPVEETTTTVERTTTTLSPIEEWSVENTPDLDYAWDEFFYGSLAVAADAEAAGDLGALMAACADAVVDLEALRPYDLGAPQSFIRMRLALLQSFEDCAAGNYYSMDLDLITDFIVDMNQAGLGLGYGGPGEPS